jgi:radical SAM protein with 4Fe4S-binding SPASM domain
VTQVISWAEREQIERDALTERERALLAHELVLPGPYEAHIGFSNVCNMSCIMCWNGANPPPRKMSAEMVQKVGEQIAPHLSVITPYDGSEPLIVAWDETREVCKRYAVELSLTTNGQFLNERRFEELRDVTETLFISIDSHIPETFAKIRPGAKPGVIYENVRMAAAAARKHGLECIVNVVFMTENGALLPETIEFLADAGVEVVHVLQMLDTNGLSGFSNPLLQFTPAYLARLKERSIEVASRRGIWLMWDVAGQEDHDFRKNATPRKPRKLMYDRWDWRMKLLFPGFCRSVRDRVRIDTDGNVAPCSYSTDGALELGNLADTPFEELWNGARMRDLRRAHYTWDYPAICSACRFKDPVGPRDQLPFMGHVLESLHLRSDVERSIELLGPPHMTRGQDAPVVRFVQPSIEVDHLFVALAPGGMGEDFELLPVTPAVNARDEVSFEIPAEAWDRLRCNVGWWWAVLGFSSSDPLTVVRSTEIRCMIRHAPLPRIAGSDLAYPDGGNRPVVDLGSVQVAERPKLAPRQDDRWAGKRKRHRTTA